MRLWDLGGIIGAIGMIRDVHHLLDAKRSRALRRGDHPMNRLLRFALGGFGGFIVQIATLAVLTEWLAVHYLIATIVSVEAAILLNFVWHERWTWRDRPATTSSERWQRLIRFNILTGLTSIAGTVLIASILVEGFSLSPVFANILSIAALGAVNFAGANMLVFKSVAAMAMLAIALPAHASGEALLQPKTARDFAKYVATVEARRARRTSPTRSRSSTSSASRRRSSARTMAALRRGEVIVTRGAARDASSNEIAIEGGLINHWRGTVFVPNVTLDQLLKVLQEPQTDKHKQEDVLSSRVISRDGEFAEGVSAAATHQVRDGGLRHRIRRRLQAARRRIARSATASRPRSSRSRMPARRRSAPCRKATITATCGGSIPTGATSRSMTACWSRSNR